MSHDELYKLCLAAKTKRNGSDEEREAAFKNIQDWLDNNDEDTRKNAACHTNQIKKSTPLHEIVAARPSMDMVSQIIRLQPETIKQENARNRLPIEVALHYDASNDILIVLFDALFEKQKILNLKLCCILQSLPDNLRRQYVLEKLVQEMIHAALIKTFPTFIILFEFFCTMIVIVCNGIAVPRYNAYIFEGTRPNVEIPSIFLLAVGVLLAVWHIFRMIILMDLGFFKIWYSHISNYVQLSCYISMIISAIIMLQERHFEDNKGAYRIFSIIFSGLYFYLLFPIGRRIFKEFAVFDRGMTEVFKRLLAFGVYVVIVLTAYALMFFTVFKAIVIPKEEVCEFCSFWSSWFQVYSMMLGNYGSAPVFEIYEIQKQSFVYFLYISFGIIIVMMLLNVLIPIVWEAYNNIQNAQSANILFWEIKLEFATHVIMISNWIICGNPVRTQFEKWWSSLTNIFEDKTKEDNYFRPRSIYSWSRSIYRWSDVQRFCFLFLLTFCRFMHLEIAIIWVLIGFISCGTLWPPQIREWFWSSSERSRDSASVTGGATALLAVVRSSETSRDSASATDQNIQGLEKMIAKLNEIMNESNPTESVENKRKMIIKINQMIGVAKALLDVVRS